VADAQRSCLRVEGTIAEPLPALAIIGEDGNRVTLKGEDVTFAPVVDGVVAGLDHDGDFTMQHVRKSAAKPRDCRVDLVLVLFQARDEDQPGAVFDAPLAEAAGFEVVADLDRPGSRCRLQAGEDQKRDEHVHSSRIGETALSVKGNLTKAAARRNDPGQEAGLPAEDAGIVATAVLADGWPM